MARMILILAVLAVGLLALGVQMAFAQTPGGPAVSPPSGQHPPRGPIQPKPPPVDIPAAVIHAPYSGPAALAPADIPVPHTQAEADTIIAQYRPRLEAAAAAAQARNAAAQARTQRVAHGDQSLLSAPDQDPGGRYTTNQRGTPPRHPNGTPLPRRSETPVERAMKLLHADLGSPPEQPAAAPDDEPSEQIPVGACVIRPYLWEGVDTQYSEDIFYAETFHTCWTLPTGDIWRMETSMHVYRCPWLISWLNVCMGVPYYVDSFIPYCENWYPLAASYQICGPKVWYPPDVGYGYLVRAYSDTWMTNGAYGNGQNDSSWLAYKCDRHLYYDSCS